MAEVQPLHSDRPRDYAGAVEAYLVSAGISVSSQRVYRISLSTWAWLAAGQQPPPGRARRGAEPPATAFTALVGPAAASTLAAAFAVRAATVDGDTSNRELSVFSAAVAWWRRQGWLETSPVLGIERRAHARPASSAVMPGR
jgi:hypothetical protein